MESGLCPQCGAPLAPAVLGGLCPRCVVGAGASAAVTESAGDDASARQPAGGVFVADSPVPPLGAEPHGADPFWSDSPPPPHIEGYDVLREVTHGGQGVVYQAVQRSTKRKVAIKVMREGPFASKASRRRFEREIELAVSLKHPNIIAVFDSGVTGHGHAYYVMDYVRGRPITQYVKEKKLGLESCLALFATACDAVNHAHQKGVIHRDLKPGNILADAEGNVRILDFGLAKALTEPVGTVVSMTGGVVGTLPYMSPEQTRGNPDEIDTRTDVYSLGVILYEMLTGRYPYPVTGQMAEVIQQISEVPPAPLSKRWTSESGVRAERRAPKLRPGRCPIEPDVETIVLKALSKDRDRRYDTAGELARDIRRYLQDEPILARRAGALYQFRRFARRNKPLVGGCVAVMVALVLGIVATTWQALVATRARSALQTTVDELGRQKTAAEAARREARGNLASGMSLWGKSLYDGREYARAWKSYAVALDAAHRFGLAEPMPVLTGMLELDQSPPPVMGFVGAEDGVGGFTGHSDKINGVAVCRDGRHAITASADKSLIQWDLLTGTPTKAYSHEDGVNLLALSPDGKTMLASDNAGKVILWDIETGTRIKTLDTEARSSRGGIRGTWAVAFSPDGQAALTGGDEYVTDSEGHEQYILRLWDLRNPKPVLKAADSRVLLGTKPHTRPIPSIAFLPDGRHAISAGHDGILKRWDLTTLRLDDDSPGQFTEINDVVILPGGRWAVTANFEGKLGFWDLDRFARVYEIEAHRGRAWRLAVSHDGTTVASAGGDGAVRLWNVASRQQVAQFYGPEGDVMAVAFSPDDGILVGGGDDGMLRAWTVPARPSPGVPVPAPHAGCASVSDGPERLVVTGYSDGAVVLWDGATGNRLRSWHPHSAAVRGVRVAPDRSVTSVAADGTVSTWNLAGTELRPLPGIGAVSGVAFLPNRSEAFCLAPDNTLVRRDLSTGQVLLPSPRWGGAVASSLSVSPDAASIIEAAGGRVRRWDLQNGQELPSRLPPNAPALAVALSGDGHSALVAGEDGKLTLWDLNDGWLPRTFDTHSGAVAAVAFSDDGRCAACAGDDGRVRFLDFSRGERLRELELSLPRLRPSLPDPGALSRFAQWHALRGKDDWAVELFEKARAGGAAVSSLQLGRCYWRRGDTSAAHAQFQRALTEPDADKDYLNLCLAATAGGPGTSPAQ